MIEKKYERIIERLATIAPKWARRISNNIVHHDLEDFRFCIVAEAWGWTNYYLSECCKCRRFSMKLYREMLFSSSALRENYTDEFFAVLDKFIRHYKHSHKFKDGITRTESSAGTERSQSPFH